MKKTIEIVKGLVYLNGQFKSNHVIVATDTIEGIYDLNDHAQKTAYNEMVSTLKASNQLTTVDAEGGYVMPGFIDVHIHGYKGVDVMDAKVSSLEAMKRNLPENGVTDFLATTMTMSKSDIVAALDTVKTVMNSQADGVSGAEIIGVHLEGPFINEDYKGAQAATYIVGADHDLLERYADIIKVVTIAPEKAGGMEAIEQFSDRMNFSIGHSGATYDQAMAAISKGASSMTHLFSAMTGLKHREPGVVGAAFTTDCYCEVIADNIHMRPELYPLILKIKGIHRMLLITDCMQGGGLAEGEYSLGGQKVLIKDGKCTLESGTIAGSVLKLNKGLENVATSTKEPLADLLPAVTLNQARYLGIEETHGSIDLGKYANIVIMHDDYSIYKTIVKGNVVYEN